MSSAAEQLAATLNWSSFSKATELKKRIWFTLGILIVYRLGTYIPIPGINTSLITEMMHNNSSGALRLFDMFSGGSFGRMTIFSLNIMPYISSSIIIQMISTLFPTLENLKKEGEYGRKKINQYTRYLTLFIAAIEAWGITLGIERTTLSAIYNPGIIFEITTSITMVGGTILLMWLGEQITQRGIGNGISIIIFTGIVAGLPQAVIETLELGRTGVLSPFIIISIMILAIFVIGFIVFIERAQRKILVHYPKRQVGTKIMQSQNSHLPLKINTAGVIPPIFASSILLMPLAIAQFIIHRYQEVGWLNSMISMLGRGQPLYTILYIIFIIFFSFFYTAIVSNTEDTAKTLKKNGGFLPGIRPGKNTALYLERILTRLTVIGSGYLAFVCILPEFLISKWSVPFYFGGTSLLITVTVTIDTLAQVQSHMFSYQYDNLIKKSKLRSHRRR